MNSHSQRIEDPEDPTSFRLEPLEAEMELQLRRLRPRMPDREVSIVFRSPEAQAMNSRRFLLSLAASWLIGILCGGASIWVWMSNVRYASIDSERSSNTSRKEESGAKGTFRNQESLTESANETPIKDTSIRPFADRDIFLAVDSISGTLSPLSVDRLRGRFVSKFAPSTANSIRASSPVDSETILEEKSHVDSRGVAPPSSQQEMIKELLKSLSID